MDVILIFFVCILTAVCTVAGKVAAVKHNEKGSFHSFFFFFFSRTIVSH